MITARVCYSMQPSRSILMRHIQLLNVSPVRYSTVQYSTVQYSTVQYSTVQYSTVQYGTCLLNISSTPIHSHRPWTLNSRPNKFKFIHSSTPHTHIRPWQRHVRVCVYGISGGRNRGREGRPK